MFKNNKKDLVLKKPDLATYTLIPLRDTFLLKVQQRKTAPVISLQSHISKIRHKLSKTWRTGALEYESTLCLLPTLFWL